MCNARYPDPKNVTHAANWNHYISNDDQDPDPVNFRRWIRNPNVTGRHVIISWFTVAKPA